MCSTNTWQKEPPRCASDRDARVRSTASVPLQWTPLAARNLGRLAVGRALPARHWSKFARPFKAISSLRPINSMDVDCAMGSPRAPSGPSCESYRVGDEHKQYTTTARTRRDPGTPRLGAVFTSRLGHARASPTRRRGRRPGYRFTAPASPSRGTAGGRLSGLRSRKASPNRQRLRDRQNARAADPLPGASRLLPFPVFAMSRHRHIGGEGQQRRTGKRRQER
jgi:hypothetical protein